MLIILTKRGNWSFLVLPFGKVFNLGVQNYVLFFTDAVYSLVTGQVSHPSCKHHPVLDKDFSNSIKGATHLKVSGICALGSLR